MSLSWVLGFAAFTLACQPSIGDSCALHSDCSQTGDRICDPTFPGGYCTIFNCEPGSCPSEAVCVAFYTTPSAECADLTERRLERTFCMKNCTVDGDCRGGYQCVEYGGTRTGGDGPLHADNGVDAVVVEHGSYNSRVCTIAAPSVASGAAAGETNVCAPSPYPDAGRRDSGVRAKDGGPRGLSDASMDGESNLDAAPRDARGGS